MAKTKISEYDSTAANNTDIDSINIAEGMAPSNVNNALRMQMAHLKTEFYKTGSNNTSLGDGALDSLDGSSPGGSNVAIGKDALTANTTADNNTAVGTSALAANTTASNNTAVGHSAFGSNTTGNKTVAVGDSALASSTTASDSVAVGFEALQSETTGSRSTAVGYQALKTQNVGSTTQNTAVGYGAGLDVTTAINSTFVGGDAGANVTTGNKNTMIGDGAGVRITTGASNTVLGRYSGNAGGLDIRTSSNNIVLSDGDGNPRLSCNSSGVFRMRTDIDQGMYIFTGGTNNTNGKVLEFFDGDSHSCGVVRINQSANTVSYNTSSDYRLKENVTELTDATTRLKQLQPKRFNFILDPNNIVHDGFLAHEVSSIVPEAISGDKDEVDADGNPVYQGIDQSKLVPLLVATIKELEARITALENA